jgi:hypothetical protein
LWERYSMPPDETLERRSQELYADGYRELRSTFDADASMVRIDTGFGQYHDPRGSLAYATCLLREGGSENLALAEEVIDRVLSMQETRPGNAHFGNFRWLFEDDIVTDLNAVEFMLEALALIILLFGDRLSPRLQERIREAMRLGLQEIERLDVHLSYTNICLLDIHNSIVCGQILGDRHHEERGRRKLDAWIAFTARSGAPHEYNSPTYLGVDLGALASLAEHASDEDTALRARLMEERLWLHVASRFHRPTCQLAGPHCRAYRHDTVGAGGFLKVTLYKELGYPELRRRTPYFPWEGEEAHVGVALGRYHLPDYLRPLFEEKPPQWQVRETADASSAADLTSYLTPDYSLGTSSRSYQVGDPPELWPQFNAAIIYYRKEEAPGYGVLYTRYAVNEYEIGHAAEENGRVRRELWDLGAPRCLQHRNLAIVAYGLTPMPITTAVNTLRLDVLLIGRDRATDILVGGRPVASLPQPVQPLEPVVLSDGSVYIGLIPLEPTNMGQEASIVLDERGGELALSIHNYSGPSKNFWEYRTLSGPFFKGNVRNGLVIEVASRGDYPSPAAFHEHLVGARLTDSLPGEGVREIEYESGGQALALRYDLRDLRVLERRVNGEVCVPPMLEAPGIVQGRSQPLATDDAALWAGGAPAWLLADKGRRIWVAAITGVERAPLRLQVPPGALEADAFALGKVVWRETEGRVEMEAAPLPTGLRLWAPPPTRLFLNREDVTARLRPAEAGGRALRLQAT